MSVHSLPSLVRGENGRLGPQEPRLRTLLKQEKDDLFSVSLWRGAFAEFVGTGLLCTFTIGFGMTPEGGEPPSVLQVSLAVGFFIGVIITTFAHVSGGHVNPAISVVFVVTGHCTFVRCLVYTLFQSMGAITGTGLLKLMAPSGHLGNLGLIQPGPNIGDEHAIVGEIFITFFLCFITVAMVDPGRSDVQGSIPLLVGLTVTVNILFVHTISGACMNPARALGPAVVTGKWNRLYLYWLGPLAGALIAGAFYDVLFSVRKLRDKRWCSPQNYRNFGDKDDGDDESGEGVTSDSVPLRNGRRGNGHRDDGSESKI